MPVQRHKTVTNVSREEHVSEGSSDCRCQVCRFSNCRLTLQPTASLQLGQGRRFGRYILSGEGAGTIFIIDEVTGDIHATKSLDRERKSHYVLHAQALDRNTEDALEPKSEFIIKVQDINDNAPKFPNGPFEADVPEMSEVGTSVLQVTATDADDPTYGNSAKVVYSILQGQPYFSVDPKTDIINATEEAAASSLELQPYPYYTPASPQLHAIPFFRAPLPSPEGHRRLLSSRRQKAIVLKEEQGNPL
ncbi:hypothetical protein WMY93_030890 [Mugilogobius chulae]|uniref:Cadherin domain-containing protein n=1 Tax=Mugilogobius chulae TaxID=88201 RepID=A0AAW0MQ30_9GOBI